VPRTRKPLLKTGNISSIKSTALRQSRYLEPSTIKAYYHVKAIEAIGDDKIKKKKERKWK